MASELPVEEPAEIRSTDADAPPIAADQPSDYPWVQPHAPPQPGFWWAVLATLAMVIASQVVIPMIVLVPWVFVRAVSGNPQRGDPTGQTEDLKADLLGPTVAIAHVTMIAVGLLALRLVAGRTWRRQVALRLPSLTHLGLVLLVFPALPILASGVYCVARDYIRIPGLTAFLPLSFSQLAVVLSLGSVWLLARLFRGQDPKPLLVRSAWPRQASATGCLCLVGALVAFVGYHAGASFLPNIGFLQSLDTGMEELVTQARTWSPFLAVLVVAGCPALSEELWFRAFLGRGLVGQYGLFAGVVITSYFFGIIHLLPHQATMAMVMGIALHFAYLTTRSLLVPMLLHFLNNAVSAMGDRLGDLLGPVVPLIDTDPDKIPIRVYALAGVLAAAVGYALYQSRARMAYKVWQAHVPVWKPAYPGVALPPSDAGTEVSHPWPSIPAILVVSVAFAAFVAAFVTATPGTGSL